MARSLRIDSLTAGPTGQLNFSVTEGVPPLPLEPSGEGVSFASAREFAVQAQGFLDGLTTEQYLFILCAEHLKAMPNYTASSLRLAVQGKSATLDFTSPRNAITIV